MTVWTQLIDEINDFTTNIRDLPVRQPVSPSEIRTQLAEQYNFKQPMPLNEVMADVGQLLRDYTVHVTHPRYFGLFNPDVHQTSIIADALVALYNPQLAVWSHAPAANEIEQHTLNTLAKAIGFEPGTFIANFTSGGGEANLTAVLTALIHSHPTIAKSGLASLNQQPTIYLTSESHHSFVKVARMTGLGTNALREIPTNNQYTLDMDALKQQIVLDKQAGFDPLMIVGTAGTTGAGLIDPLPQIAKLAQESGIWFHVDAAWGGSAALSPKLRPHLRGIEQADSVTWDAHKWLSVPMGAGMFFCCHPEAVKQAFAICTSYMPDGSGDGTIDTYSTTAQWSRRFIGLKLFMVMAELGLDEYGRLITHQATLGNYLRERLQQKGWLVRNQTPLPVICFTHPDIVKKQQTISKILNTIYARGNVWISDVVLGGQERVLRACMTSFRATKTDVDYLIDELEYARVI